jgi:succinoglycan biosynthesis protein ExoV
MLVRRVNLPKYAKKHPVSFMPHVSNARLSDWRHICNELGVYYIDPRNDVDKFLGELISSELILTEAMHGAILADALRVPWVPVSTAPHILDFKWNDWCGSVGVDYKPTRMTTLWSLPDGASIMGRAKHYFKYKIAYLELKKAIINSRPCLSEESKLSSCLDALEERLFDFKTDYERGRYR